MALEASQGENEGSLAGPGHLLCPHILAAPPVLSQLPIRWWQLSPRPPWHLKFEPHTHARWHLACNQECGRSNIPSWSSTPTSRPTCVVRVSIEGWVSLWTNDAQCGRAGVPPNCTPFAGILLDAAPQWQNPELSNFRDTPLNT